MWSKKDLNTWTTEHLKQWWQDLDDNYNSLTRQGQFEADTMMMWIYEIVKRREKVNAVKL